MARMVSGSFAVVALVVLFPSLAAAQLDAIGIAGAVRDTSGAVLPGVTVKASSRASEPETWPPRQRLSGSVSLPPARRPTA
jgi:hypothetical protein